MSAPRPLMHEIQQEAIMNKLNHPSRGKGLEKEKRNKTPSSAYITLA